jgi:RNA polymerase sigma-70 factor (ECF subfamily)
MSQELVPSNTPTQAEADDLSEAETIRLAQEGDAADFERIFRRYSRRVYALCLRMARNKTDAEDLTQEAFLQLFRKIHTFRGESAFSTWLYRVCANVVLMWLRKKGLMEIHLENTQEEKDSNREEISAPDLVLSGTIDRLILDRAINELPTGYKKAFMLHDVEGYEHHEIAEILGCSIGNSKSQLHKARMQLRNLLQAAPISALQAAS